MYRDPSCNIEQTHSTMKHLYLDDRSRRDTNGSEIAGRGAAMVAEPTPGPDRVICRYCNKSKHYQWSCDLFTKDKRSRTPAFKRGKAGSEGAAGNKRFFIHISATQNDADCYLQGAPRPQQGASHITTTYPQREHRTHCLVGTTIRISTRSSTLRVASCGWPCLVNGPSGLTKVRSPCW